MTRLSRRYGATRVFAALLAIAVPIGLTVFDAQCARGQAPAEQTYVYGKSVKGRPLVAYILGSGANVTLVSGGVHGNETSAPGLVQRLRAYLKDHPEQLDGCKAVLIPNVNPDGDAAGTRANADGVDLNRNFPAGWMGRRKGIALSPGARALSEPESRGLIAVLDRFHPSKAVSVHWPFHMLVWSGESGKALAEIMQKENGYRFSDDVGYPTPGSFGSYLYRVRRIACVTLELPRESVDLAWEQNRAALLAAIHYAPENRQ